MKPKFANVLFKCISLTMFVVGCASAPKGELSSSANPSDEIARLSSDLDLAQKSNVDVLARKEYLTSVKNLNEAKKDLADGKDQEEVIDDLRFGKEALTNAKTKAASRRNAAPGLFQARQSAISSGASSSAALKNEWTSLDEDVSSQSEKLESMKPESVAKYQARYVELEKQAVIEEQIGSAKAKIIGARNDGAMKLAPVALRKAEISVTNAESLIGSNVRNTSGFSQSVRQAQADAQYLSEMMSTITLNGKTLSEATAGRMIAQRHQISSLQSDLNKSEVANADSELRLDETNKTLSDREGSLKTADAALRSAEASVALQSAIESSRQQFGANEAEAYQQGDNLLIRLKSMKFESGRSEVPNQSLQLLAKVSEIAKSLGATEIKVEGHTDSLGNSAFNEELSAQRANSVASYFKSNGFESAKVSAEGHSFENPIATNKSKEGRAQNRRVDVIITPEINTMIRQ